jgi:hypothetical protein
MTGGLILTVGVLATRTSASADAPDLVYVANSTKRVCQLTGDFDRASGKPTLNQTGKRFGVTATDLGSSFEHKGKLYFLFGDTWGRPGDRDVLAWTESTNPAKILLQFPKANDGKWLPLTVPGIKQGAFEIPSGGISIADTIYIVCTTDHSETKVMGRSVLARSQDDGRTFKLLDELWIRDNEKKFPFIAIFPRSVGTWSPFNGDYARVIRMLDEVLKAYRADPKRVYLTGYSKGGWATWELAVAFPRRWAAIVPVCGFALDEPKKATRIKDVPCWCFHGAKDEAVTVSNSRQMIKTLRAAGGKPRLTVDPQGAHSSSRSGSE